MKTVLSCTALILALFTVEASANLVWDGPEYTGPRPVIKKAEIDRVLEGFGDLSFASESEIAGCWFCDAARDWFPFLASAQTGEAEGDTILTPSVDGAYMWYDKIKRRKQ